jgi:hypothetical protein
MEEEIRRRTLNIVVPNKGGDDKSGGMGEDEVVLFPVNDA